MKLTSKKVEYIFQYCLATKAELDTRPTVLAEGILYNPVFDTERLAQHQVDIQQLLLELPELFRASHITRGGSFLLMCERADGVHWGEHRNCEQLLTLGVATKQVEYLAPREVWYRMPGGVPYFKILDEQFTAAAL